MPRGLACSLSVAALALACVSSGRSPQAERVVDLTHPFDDVTVYWPTAEGFRLRVDSEGETPGGYFYRANSFCAAEHGGTHLDAPSHFSLHGQSVDAIPLARLLGPGVVVDVSARCSRNPDCTVSVADLEAFEALHGPLPAAAIVLLRTGYGERWPDRAAYLGSAERGAAAVAKLRFPGLDAAAALWLAEQRGIDAVGIDTASIDPGHSTRFEAHRALAARDVPIFENVARLEQLPATGFRVVALPMKIGGGSGGPLRVIAWLEGEP
jgi:kynurenine formamidase